MSWVNLLSWGELGELVELVELLSWGELVKLVELVEFSKLG